MSSRSVTEALTLYQNETLTLEQAARRAGILPTELKSKLRSSGISVRK